MYNVYTLSSAPAVKSRFFYAEILIIFGPVWLLYGIQCTGQANLFAKKSALCKLYGAWGQDA